MISLFDRELMRMEQEVRDLKTCHEIPVGSLNFYSKTGQATITGGLAGDLYVRLTLKPGEPADPYAQAFIRSTDDGKFSEWVQYSSIENGGTLIQYVFIVSPKTYEANAICSADFDLIVKEFEESDWVGEWPF